MEFQDAILDSIALERPVRRDWGDFPAVVANGGLSGLSAQPEYAAAKAGDELAAVKMVDRLMTADFVSSISGLVGDARDVWMLPVVSEEMSGRNRIPGAIARVLANRLGLQVETGIVQANRVFRTDSTSDHRLAFRPAFDGVVTPGRRYLIVDDTLTMGGTIAELRGFVIAGGGVVVGAAVMTAAPGSCCLPAQPLMLELIRAKHGAAMDDLCRKEFHHDLEQLTQAEAGHFRAARSADALRDRIAAARLQAIGRGHEKVSGPARDAPPPLIRAEHALEVAWNEFWGADPRLESVRRIILDGGASCVSDQVWRDVIVAKPNLAPTRLRATVAQVQSVVRGASDLETRLSTLRAAYKVHASKLRRSGEIQGCSGLSCSQVERPAA